MLTSPHPVVRVGILVVLSVTPVAEQCYNTYRIDTSEHVPHELGRCTKSAQDADSSDSLPIQGVQRRTSNGVC